MSVLEPLREFLTARRVSVVGHSMLPAFREGQRLVVSHRAYRRRRPARFDVVLLAAPNGEGREDLKRLVGLPGESVVLDGGMLLIDGTPVEEPHLPDTPCTPDAPESSFNWQPGEGEYVVLGDNRKRSTDSREYGVIALGRIVGPVVR